jgi:hypothetical protein
MALEGYDLTLNQFELSRGPIKLDADTGSTLSSPTVYNQTLPTGTSEVNFLKANLSVTVIDPNGNGTCSPRLVAAASFKSSIINSSTAVAGAPFQNAMVSKADFGAIFTFFRSVIDSLPALPTAPDNA